MPRYFFDLLDDDLNHDWEGADFPNARDAAMHALTVLPTIAADEVESALGLPDGLAMIVRDASGCSIYAATVSLLGTWLPGCPMQGESGLPGPEDGVAEH